MSCVTNRGEGGGRIGVGKGVKEKGEMGMGDVCVLELKYRQER